MFTGQIIEVFNEGNDQLAQIARTAIRLYAISFLFTGLNFMGIYYFSAVQTENGANDFLFAWVLLIVPVLFILVKLLGLTGVWLAMPVVEFVTFGLMLVGYLAYRNYLKRSSNLMLAKSIWEIIERHIINKEVQFARPEMRMITAKTIFVVFAPLTLIQ